MLDALLIAALPFHVAIVLAWLLTLLLVRGLNADDRIRIAPLPEGAADGPSPSLAVFVAAHNEQARIEKCLRGLRAQAYPGLRIVVVNDRSRDATGDRVRSVMAATQGAAGEPEIRLIEIDRLPEGWIGKTHALAVAARQVDADYFLFVDGDCRLAPGALAAVMRKVVEEDLEFITLWPFLELKSFWERLLTPAAAFVLGFWTMLSFLRQRDGSKVRLGNGQFMLMSRRAYEQVGGHASVSAELAEDAVIAAKVAELGLRRWAGLGRGLYVTTRDNRAPATVNALARVFIGSLRTPGKVLLSTQWVMGGLVLPLWLGPLSLYFALTTGSGLAWAFLCACLIQYATMCATMRRIFGITLAERGTVLHLPVGGAGCLLVLLWSCWVMTGRGSIRWGASRYRVRGSRIVQALSGASPSMASGSA